MSFPKEPMNSQDVEDWVDEILCWPDEVVFPLDECCFIEEDCYDLFPDP